jgi:aminopeptidase N
MKNKRYFFSVALILIAMSLTAISSNAFLPNKNKLHSDTIDVLNYSIHLDMVYLSQKTIKGYTDLTIVPKINNLSLVQLDLLSLTVDSILCNSTICAYNYNDTLLKINLPTPHNISDTFHLKVYYGGHPQSDPAPNYWGGFFFTTDSIYAYNIGVGFASNPHNFGRVWFPCIDDFIDRATFDCYIRVKNTKMAVCGGTLISQIDNLDGTKTFHWQMSNTIPTYLASVAVSDYVAVKDTFPGLLGNIPSFIYVRPSDTTKAKGTFIHLKNAFAIYENRFGPYRWQRVGYVGVPFTAGAMEHATNIAFPILCITGNLTYETILVHEFSHHWFGDLVTCSSALDMWLNEGWASWCESMFLEDYYGKITAKNYSRTNHKEVLQFAHIDDGGYLALYGIPHEYTYGSTVYKKGADVVHTLRNYLGDSLFFSGVKAYLNTYAFKDASTINLRDFLTTNTGVNMNDFFDAWVLHPGFPHFAVDSFKVNNISGDNHVTVYVRQKLKGATILANSNRMEVTFMNDQWQQYTGTLQFSGATGSATFIVPFVPTFAMIDKEEKMEDATTDNYQTIKTIGSKTFPETYCSLNVQSITDSAFVRIEHHWVAPDPFKTPVLGLFLSDYRYWSIDGILPNGFVAQGKFSYNKTTSTSSGYLDNTLITNSIDSLVILYRANTSDDWHLIPFTRTGGATAGTVIVDSIRKGEYTLAIWDYDHLGGIHENHQKKQESLKIFPNPSSNYFTVQFDIKSDAVLKMYNLHGEEVDSMNVFSHQTFVYWDPANLPAGTYIVKLQSLKTGKIISQNKAIIVK